MPEQVVVDINPHQSVTANVYSPPNRRNAAAMTLILGHGAGANQNSGFMVGLATGLAHRGIAIVTFNFLYSEQGRPMPDPANKLESCYRAVIAYVRQQPMFSRGGLAIGGKSMGGRIASQIAAAGHNELAGLVFLGYPLHPPNKPDQLRAKHLPAIKVPMLFIQGSRDAFGTPEELRPIIAGLKSPVALYVVEGGDHSFNVSKRLGGTQEHVYQAIQDQIESWLRCGINNSHSLSAWATR